MGQNYLLVFYTIRANFACQAPFSFMNGAGPSKNSFKESDNFWPNWAKKALTVGCWCWCWGWGWDWGSLIRRARSLDWGGLISLTEYLITGIDLVIDLDADLGIACSSLTYLNCFDKIANWTTGNNVGLKRVNAGCIGSREINQELTAGSGHRIGSDQAVVIITQI